MKSKSKIEQSINGVSSRILNYIYLHPGASFKNIKIIFNIPDSTLRYHLTALEKKGKIRSNTDKRIYYPLDCKGKKYLSKIQQILIYHIKKHPGITRKKMLIKTNLNRLTIKNNINSLMERKLIFSNKIGRDNHYFYSDPEKLEKHTMLKIITKLLLNQIDEETYWELRERIVEN